MIHHKKVYVKFLTPRNIRRTLLFIFTEFQFFWWFPLPISNLISCNLTFRFLHGQFKSELSYATLNSCRGGISFEFEPVYSLEQKDKLSIFYFLFATLKRARMLYSFFSGRRIRSKSSRSCSCRVISIIILVSTCFL